MPRPSLPLIAVATVVLFLALAATAPAQLFFPPGVFNPGADLDVGDDLFVSHVIGPDSTIHAVWVSQVDHTGTSGGDPDLFYRQLPPGGTWSAPELVNTYGTIDGGADERNPRLALDAAGVVHCVWQSQHPFGGSGTDWDVFYARRTGAGWQLPEAVNAATSDNGSLPREDVNPAIAVQNGNEAVVTWETNVGSPDRDLAYRIRTASGWSTIGAVNDNAVSDSGDDLGPAAMATLADGDVVAVWSTDDEFRSGVFGVGGDRDVVWSRLGPSGWSPMQEVTELARAARRRLGVGCGLSRRRAERRSSGRGWQRQATSSWERG